MTEAKLLADLDALARVLYQGGTTRIGDGNTVAEAAAELRRLGAECEQLRKYKAAAMLMVEDADRYHRLRNGQNWPAVFANSEDPEPLRGAELDAAMKETK